MQHFGVCKKRAIGIPMPLPVLLNKYRQAVRIMKLTAFILLVCSLHVSAGGFSQSITLSEKNAPLIKVFKAIEKQTDFIFFYNIEWINKTEKVNINVKNTPLQQTLDLLFKNQPITYSITGKMITVFPKKNEVKANNLEASSLLNLHGRVVDENGKPVAGVTVTVKGTKNQTITDENGEFIIKGVEGHAVLSFSTVNMEPFEINVSGQTEILAKLRTKTSELDQVQIIAYGQTTKRFQTGNVSSVKGEDIQKQPVQNPLLALQGRVPGLIVTQINGIPGGGLRVSIQGKNSIGRGNDPLIIVDGVPFPSQMPSTGVASPLGGDEGFGGSGNPLAFINPSDVESIDVLKDADATAIYGSRAANGAILITTKKGKAGKTRLDINMQQGWSKVERKIKMLNTRQYLDMRYEAFRNDKINWTASNFSANDLKIWDTTRYTDWQKTLIGNTAHYTNINASISGGSANIQYLVGSTFSRQTTVFPGDFSDKTVGVYTNLKIASTNQKLTLQLSANYLTSNNQLPGGDLTSSAVLTEPNAPSLFNEDGSLNWAPNATGASTWNNPIVSNLTLYSNRTNNLISNAVLEYRILPGLEIKTSMGYSDIQTNDFRANPLNSIKPEFRAIVLRSADYGARDLKSWIIEPQIDFKRNLFKGKIDILVGSTILDNSSNGNTITGRGYNSDAVLKDLSSAATLTAGYSYVTQYKYNALFGRFNYNWQDKYIVNLTARRDGSSRFGPANRFHNFGAAGAAWIFSNERWIKNRLSFLSFGKLRGSYGTTGSDQIGDYFFMSLYGPVIDGVTTSYQGITGLAPDNLTNPYLEWEETKKLSAGLDLGFFADRFLLSANYARNRSSNQLLFYFLPTITGFNGIAQNFSATVQNISWEFLLSTINVKSKDFSWSSSVNFTIPNNKLISFPGLETSSYSTSLIVDRPLSFTRLYSFAGIDPTTGKYIVYDSMGNTTSTPNPKIDRQIFVSNFPKWYGGIQNNVVFRGFRLDFLFQFVKQPISDVYFSNGRYLPGIFQPGLSNQPVTVMDRWTKPGENTNIRKFTTSLLSSFSEMPLAAGSDKNYFDDIFVRLKNVSLSWQLPEQWIKKMRLQNCRIYTQGQNILTITKYNGLDPETRSLSALPPLRVITVGIQVSL